MSNPNLVTLRALRLTPDYANGRNARILNLALGLVRGRPISRTESPNSNPHLFPGENEIYALVERGYRPIADGQTLEDYQSEKTAFLKNVRNVIRTWQADLYLSWTKRQLERALKPNKPHVRGTNPQFAVA